MTHSFASVSVGGHSFQISLGQLHQILNDPKAADCKTRFKRAQLLRQVGLVLRRSDPARYRALSLGGGPYWLGIGGEFWECRTLAGILVTAMGWLHEHDQKALLCLSQRRKHSRAYIATDPVALYGGRRALAKYAKPFAAGWYVDTNLSFANSQRFLLDAFKLAKLTRGQDWYFDRLK